MLLKCVLDPSSSSSNTNMSGGHSYTHEMLEHENDQLVNTLSDKVATLKSVSTWYVVALYMYK